MQYPVKVVYDDGHSIQEGYFYLNGAEMTGLTIISQNPWEIDAIWSDGSYTDVTDLCTFTYNGNTVLIEYNGFFVTGELAIESTDPLSVFMEYSDGSEFDVTEDCQITYDGDEIIVEYEELVVSGAWLIVSNLQITTPPTKTSYTANEEIDYSGIVVKYVHSDGSEHDVTKYCDFDPASGTVITQTTYATISCAPPLEPYVYDQNSGYINNGIWQVELPTSTYIDIYQVQAGHKYWLTLGAKVGSRFRAMFTTIDISQASSNVTGTSIINANNPATYASVTYTPSSNGYIAVAKDNAGVSGLYTYLFDTSATSKTESVTLPLSVATLASIAVTTMPDQTDYRDGAAIDFSGIAITATMSDGGTRPVNAEDCTFSPIEGTAFDSSSLVVTVSYELGGITAITTFNLCPVTLVSINASPNNQQYVYGEQLSYSTIEVTGLYSDNSTEDVTSLASFNPVAGTTVFAETSPRVTVSVENISTDISLTIIPKEPMFLSVSGEPLNLSIGGVVDYTGLTVTMLYTDNTTLDVTSVATFTPSAGTLITQVVAEGSWLVEYDGLEVALDQPRVASYQLLNAFDAESYKPFIFAEEWNGTQSDWVFDKNLHLPSFPSSGTPRDLSGVNFSEFEDIRELSWKIEEDNDQMNKEYYYTQWKMSPQYSMEKTFFLLLHEWLRYPILILDASDITSISHYKISVGYGYQNFDILDSQGVRVAFIDPDTGDINKLETIIELSSRGPFRWQDGDLHIEDFPTRTTTQNISAFYKEDNTLKAVKLTELWGTAYPNAIDSCYIRWSTESLFNIPQYLTGWDNREAILLAKNEYDYFFYDQRYRTSELDDRGRLIRNPYICPAGFEKTCSPVNIYVASLYRRLRLNDQVNLIIPQNFMETIKQNTIRGDVVSFGNTKNNPVKNKDGYDYFKTTSNLLFLGHYQRNSIDLDSMWLIKIILSEPLIKFIFTTQIFVSTYPTEIIEGDTLDYSEVTVFADKSYDGGFSDITQYCTFSPIEGSVVTNRGYNVINISYENQETSFEIYCKYVTRIRIDQYPIKTNYTEGEAIDYTGIIISARYNNNSQEYYEVTSKVIYSVPEGTLFTDDITVTATYTTGSHSATTTFTLTKGA